MAQANIIKSPTDEVLESAKKEYEVIDKRGRVIKLKKPSIRCNLTLAKALGQDAKNEVYMQMLLPLYFISSIDGDPVGSLSVENELFALYDRLDDDGIIAVANGIRQHWGIEENESEVKDKIKK
jgi:hypothetical protein